MPYTINKTNGTLISTVQDGTVDAKSLDITLVGKNYSGYGNIFNENFVQMLENFSATTPPTKPLTGQLYFNSALRTLRLYTGVGTDPWKSVGIIENSNSKPAGYNAGDLWWKTDEGRLYAYTGAGTSWTLVGPLTSKTGASGALESTVLRASTGSDIVVKIVTNGDEVAIASDVDNTSNGGTKNTDPSYNNFPYIKKGITLPAYTIGATDGVSYRPPPNGGGGYILWGTAASALGLVSAADGTLHYTDEYLLIASLASLNNKINVNNDNGVLVGIQGVLGLHITDSTVGNVTNMIGNALRFNVGTSNSTSTQGGSFYNVFYITTGSNNSSYILPNSTATVYIGTATQTFDYAYINTATFTTVTSTVLTGATINGTTAIRDNGNRVITSFTLNVGRGLDLGNSQSTTITGPTGTLNLVNTGTLTVTGTANQVNVTAGQNPVLSLPQSIDTGATVTFNNITGTTRIDGGAIYDNTSRVITQATIAANGVTNLTGTANQISVSASKGAVTLSLPQNIQTGATPTFNSIALNAIQTQSGSGTVYGNWTLAGGATWQATFADLAERYAADNLYVPGTVLIVGGTQEVTITTERANVARAGIVSTNPAFTLNATAGDAETHPYIALAGRVPCKVTGMIKKGDLLVTSNLSGHAEAAQLGDNPNAVIGRALENFVGDSGVIEVMVI